MKLELQKQRLELDRKREEEEMRKRRELAGVHKSTSIEVPPQAQAPTLTVEVPPTVLEVSRAIHFVSSSSC